MKRVEKLQHILQKKQIDVALFFDSRNIFYLTGTGQNSVLLVTAFEPATLFVRRNIDRARDESPIKEIISLTETKQIFRRIEAMNIIHRIGLEMGSLRAQQYLRFVKQFPNAEFVNLTPIIERLRAVKDPKEQELIRKSAKVGERVQAICREYLRAGMTELELAGEIKREITKFGSIFAYFNHYWARTPFIIASGENLWARSDFPPVLCGIGGSKAVPHGPSHRIIQNGDMVVVDVATVVEGYTSDHARTYFVGKPTNKYIKRYNSLLKARNIGIEMIRETVTPKEIYRTVEKALPPELTEYFQGFGDNRVGLGHGIGLALDDLPYIVKNSEIPLEKGNVLAFEPKIIIPDWGAIDFEDDLIVRKEKSPEILTHSPL